MSNEWLRATLPTNSSKLIHRRESLSHHCGKSWWLTPLYIGKIFCFIEQARRRDEFTARTRESSSVVSSAERDIIDRIQSS